MYQYYYDAVDRYSWSLPRSKVQQSRLSILPNLSSMWSSIAKMSGVFGLFYPISISKAASLWDLTGSLQVKPYRSIKYLNYGREGLADRAVWSDRIWALSVPQTALALQRLIQSFPIASTLVWLVTGIVRIGRLIQEKWWSWMGTHVL